MLLQEKTVVVVGASGAIGQAVARRAAREGARLHLVGRTEAPLVHLAAELGARSHVADATDETAVERALGDIVDEAGGVDLTFCAVGPRPDALGYGLPVTTLTGEQFRQTLAVVAGAQFLVARAAARHMVPAGHGAIVTLSASLSGQFVPFMTGITAACSAIEGLTRSLAAEVGPAGVRVVCVRAGGMPSTRTIQETTAAIGRTVGAPIEPPAGTLRRRPLVPDEVAAAVAFLGSDEASGIAGQVVNVCAGSVVSR